MSHINRRVNDLINIVTAACDAVLPYVSLASGERMARSGRLFTEGKQVTRSVAWALRTRKGLYDDIALDPDELQDQQERADCWAKVHLMFTMLAQRAADCYVLEQSTAIESALGVVNRVRADSQFPPPHRHAHERAVGMLVPEEYLANWQKRRVTSAKKKKQSAPKAAGTGRRGTAQKEAMRDQEKIAAARSFAREVALFNAASDAAGQAGTRSAAAMPRKGGKNK